MTMTIRALFVFPLLASSLIAQTSVAPPLGQSSYAAPYLAAKAFPPSLSLNLGWNESYREGIAIPISNGNTKPMTVIGVQASPNLFVEDFTRTVPAGGTGSITLVYFSLYNATGDTDIVRILTDSGEVDIPVSHSRVSAYQVDNQQLTWHVNDAAAAKTVNLTMAAGTTTPQSVRALGAGNTATLTPTGGNTYQIAVTPGSTSVAGSFPVIVTLNPTLPGGPLVVTCNIVASN